MLPVIAMYLVQKEFEQNIERALETTDEIMQISRLKGKSKNQRLGRLPFGYGLFRLFSKSVVSKQYPKEGWEVEWVTRNEKEVHFTVVNWHQRGSTQCRNSYLFCTRRK